MTYAKLCTISLLTLNLSAINYSSEQVDSPEQIAQQVDKWLYENFAISKFEDLTFTEELLMRIKQYLIAQKYVKNIPHHNLKKVIKQQITALQEKKYRSQKWFAKNKKELTNIIKQYFKKNSHNRWGIYQYLNVSTNPVCKDLQRTMKRSDMLPAVINDSVKSLINHVKEKENK